MELSNIDKLLIIRDFISWLDEEGMHEPTIEDIQTYVTGCWYDIVYDDSIEDAQAFEQAMTQHLNKFLNFINEK